MLLKHSQYSQENDCVGVSFWESCRPKGLIFIKKHPTIAVFFWICGIFKNRFFNRTPPVVAFEPSIHSEMISCIWGLLKSLLAQKCILTLLEPYSFRKINVYKVVIGKEIIISLKNKTKQTNKQKSLLYNQTRKSLRPYSAEELWKWVYIDEK